MSRDRKFLYVALAAFALTAVYCGEDTKTLGIVTPTPSTLPAASPSPSPTPDPCAAESVIVRAKRSGDIVYAWTPGQIATDFADPTDILGQIVPGDCPGVQVVGWRFSGTAVCNPQGPLNIRSLRDVCDTVGSHRVDATINQRVGSAEFSIIDAALAKRLTELGVDWEHLPPLELRAAIAFHGLSAPYLDGPR